MTQHTKEEIERAQARLMDLDPADQDWEDTTDLREIAEKVDQARAAQARIRELVTLARANGRSWGEIGLALGVTRQAAQERFGQKVVA